MDAWTRVIVEWANCLGIVQSSIEDIQDLADGVFYEKLISELCRGNEQSFETNTTKTSNEQEQVSKFINAEYPEFPSSGHHQMAIPEDIYIASLLLVQCSQQLSFHRPMCISLKHETQIQIKKFLELVLPCGKKLTRATIGAAITELGDIAAKNSPTTPKIRPLREFFNSPAVRSARSQRFINDRNRELMALRAQLETEQFEKIDLREDLKIQDEKIQNLQKKLQEKSRELRELKNERFKPATPQSCRKKMPSGNEERYAREIEKFETTNLDLQMEIEKLKDERLELTRRLTSNCRITSSLKEKLEQSEKCFEGLSDQLEMKNNEMLVLRMNNEELREHIRQIQKSSINEESFDIETTEAMSSIVDIQLQEAREESSELKNQLVDLKKKFDDEKESYRRLEDFLAEKNNELESIRQSHIEMEQRLSLANQKTSNYELENSELAEKLRKIQIVLKTKEELLIMTEKCKNDLELNYNSASSKIQELKNLVENDKCRVAELESIVATFVQESEDLKMTLSTREEKLNRLTIDKEILELNVEERSRQLQESEISLSNKKLKIAELEIIIERLQEETQNLKNELETSQENISGLEEKKNVLELNLQASEKRLENTEEFLELERAQIVDLKSTILENKKEMENLQNLLEVNEEILNKERLKIHELESIIGRNKRDSDVLKSMLKELKNSLENEKLESEELKTMVSRSEEMMQQLESLLKSREELLEESQKRETSLELELNSCRVKIENLESSLHCANLKSSELEWQISLSKENCLHLETNLTAKENSLRRMEVDKKALKKELEISNAKILEIELNLENLKEKFVSVEEEKNLGISANEKLEAYAREADKRMVKLEMKISDYEGKIDHLEKTTKEEKTRFKNLEQEFEEKNLNLDSLGRKLEEMEIIKFSIENCLETSEKKIAELIELGEEMESQLAAERTELTIVRGEKKAFEETLANYVQSIAYLEEKIVKINEELEKSENKLQKEKETNQDLRKTENGLLSIIKELEEKLSVETNKLAITLSEKDNLEEKLVSYSQSTRGLEEKIAEIEKELTNSEEKLEKEIEMSERLKNVEHELEEKLEEEKNELAKVLKEKLNLEAEFMSCAQSTKNLEEKITIMERELKKTEEKLQKEIEISDGLKKVESELQGQLEEEKNKLAIVLNEKLNLEAEFMSHTRFTKNLEEQIRKTEQELKNSETHLEKEIVTSEALRKVKIELEEQLDEEKNKLATSLSEKLNVEAEFMSCSQSKQILEEQITQMERELRKTEEKLQQEIETSKDLRNTVNELEMIKNELEEKLLDEKNKLINILREKDEIGEDITNYVQCTKKLEEKMAKMEKELESCEEKIQRGFETSEELRKSKYELRTTVTDLEDKLSQEKKRFGNILNEKIHLEEDLTNYVQSTTNLREKILNTRTDLEKTEKKLQKQIEANTAMERREFESKELQEKLNEELTQERNERKNLETEKKRLEDELSTLSRSKADMNEEISALHNELEASRRDLQKQRESNEKDGEFSHLKITELTQESKLLMDHKKSLENQVEKLKGENKLLIESSNEKIKSLTDLVTSLEKRLSHSERTSEELRIEEKLKQEALKIVHEKLEKMSKEKIVSELRMKELIMNLQEVRTSQDQVLNAQTEALKKNSLQLEETEKELIQLKNCLRAKTSELEVEKSKFTGMNIEFEILMEKNEKEEKLVNELRGFLELERREVREKTNLCESLKSKMEEINEVSKSLKIELNALWESIRNACPELARPMEDIVKNDDFSDLSQTVAIFADDAKTICKAVSILSEANETLKEHLDGEREISRNSTEEARKQKLELENAITQRNLYLSLLAERKKKMQELLSRSLTEREKVDDELKNSSTKWKLLARETEKILTIANSACDELKHLQVERNELDDFFTSFHSRHSEKSKIVLNTLCKIFLWSETKLQEVQNVSTLVKSEFYPEIELSEEENELEMEIRDNEKMSDELKKVTERMNEFSTLLKSYEISVKSGTIKREASNEEKLEAELEKITRERREMKEKLEASRIRNAKMEKNMDELRNENKKLKTDILASSSEGEMEIERLRELVEKLKVEGEEMKKKLSDEKQVGARLAEVHNEYGLKLDKIKQKMKTAYNEQIAKLNQEQEKAIKEKMEALKIQMEAQCRKYTEDIAKYKAHISDLSSRYWDVGEKLLAETQEKQAALQQIQQLKGQQQHRQQQQPQQQLQQGAIAEVNEQTVIAQSRHQTASLDRREFATDRAPREPAGRSGFRAVQVIEEETTFSTRRHSVKSIQAMGNAFNAEDEEGEVFASVYLADLKEGRCAPVGPDFDRLSELRMRNSMCRPHLKSSYAVETHLQPVALNEDDIKNGVTSDDVFNDSLSQSLLPGQKPKKKDRTQTSYKRPGPPTPSKNGGRLSLQGNELKSPSSRILKERNVDRRTTATPRGLKNLFGNSMSKRQDENTAGTPKGSRLSNIFRKQRERN